MICRRCGSEMRMGRFCSPRLKKYQIRYQCMSCFFIDTRSVRQTAAAKSESESYVISRAKWLEAKEIANLKKQAQESADWWNLYSEYLDSDEWKEKRAKILNRDKNTCQACGAAANVVHHLTYKRLFHEFDHDLVSLCSDCHDIIHKK